MAGPSRIPVLLLTGFLGSGKTTLLNRLARKRPPHQGKLAIVVNEFGDVGIDGDLLPPSMTRQVELPGGCICCVLNEDLDKTLLELVTNTPELETIVIETTGIAEPLPISWALARAPVSEKVRLAAVITVVDALNFVSSRELGPSVDAQVDYADILVLSKTDILEAPALPDDLVAALDAINPTALRLTGSVEHTIEMLWRAIADPAAADPLEGDAPVQNHYHPLSHEFSSVWLPIDELIDFECLTEELESLPASYVRIKGIARVIDESIGSNEPRWIAFHRVGARVSWEPLAKPASARIVAIGTAIERSRLAACVRAAVVVSGDLDA